jgi:SAM-dependent methyltransferase
MKPAVQRILACPQCRSSLELEVLEADANEVIDGRFRCACGIEYPIIQGVPRLLPPDLLASLEEDYPDFFRKHGGGRRTPRPQTAVTAIKRRTQEAFGYEWTWAADYHCDNFSDWLPEGFNAREGFAGKLGLEVGCGAGRHAAATAAIAGEHIAVDLSRAVDSAFARTRALPNCHVIQADAMHLPFAERTFDYVYCLGVLQHMPDPEAGFRALARQPRSGGVLLANVYQASRPVVLFLLECFRKLTTRMSPAAVRYLSVAMGTVEYGLFIGPWKRLRETRVGRWLRRFVPDRLDESAKDDFDTCITDWFDRLACPVKKHYTRADLMHWYASSGYSEIAVTPFWKAFWNGYGRRPASLVEPTAMPRLSSLAASPAVGGDR